jgi:hypothetical protein
MSELFTLLAVLLFTGTIIWFIVSGYSVRLNVNEGPVMEGLETMDGKPASTASATPTKSGEGGNAANYAAKIKANVVKLQDSLLITKYRQDYENTIINLDDLINFLMLKQVLNINTDGGPATTTGLQNLVALKNSKDALNTTMTFLDKQ